MGVLEIGGLRGFAMANLETTTALTRRGLLRRGSLLAGGSLVAGGMMIAGPAAAKVSQKGVSYQPTPKGAARCDKCKFWQPPAACKVVDGVISPAGWCTLYATK
ncbi:MAG: hypothetical protein ACYC8V_14755 [Caulobacteraceae bacterium]